MGLAKVLLIIALVLFVIGGLAAGTVISTSISLFVFLFWGLAFWVGSALVP